MFFISTATVEKTIQEISLKYYRSYATGMLPGYTAQKISKACTALAEAANLSLLANMDSQYILFDLKEKQFLVLSKQEQIFASR